MASATETLDLQEYLPEEYSEFDNPQTALPALAKDKAAMSSIASALAGLPTQHKLVNGDARQMALEPSSVHLVVTSPPYWTL